MNLFVVLFSNKASPSTAANEYYVGFFRNIERQGTMTLFITTAESVPVPFTLSSSMGLIYSGIVTNSVAQYVTLPNSFAVLNNTVRDKGVWVQATDAITVHGMNYLSSSADGFVALPYYAYHKKTYTYYAVSIRSISRYSVVLLVDRKSVV